jgi:hypothetical protein
VTPNYDIGDWETTRPTVPSVVTPSHLPPVKSATRRSRRASSCTDFPARSIDSVSSASYAASTERPSSAGRSAKSLARPSERRLVVRVTHPPLDRAKVSDHAVGDGHPGPVEVSPVMKDRPILNQARQQ